MASFELDDQLAADTPPATLRAYAEEILRRATVILPDLVGSAVESFTLGIRSIPQDSFPSLAQSRASRAFTSSPPTAA